jgi:hypothetical protein
MQKSIQTHATGYLRSQNIKTGLTTPLHLFFGVMENVSMIKSLIIYDLLITNN